MDLSKHLVLDLNHVVRVEEIAVAEKRMSHSLGARIECALMP
jgi:hypothetical protein